MNFVNISYNLTMAYCWHDNFSITIIIQTVLMETSGLLMEEMSSKDVWKSVSMEHGALCVMIFGVATMPVLLADNWDLM